MKPFGEAVGEIKLKFFRARSFQKLAYLVLFAEFVLNQQDLLHKYPSLWLERVSTTTVVICERPVTSPRIIRSGKVVNVDLNPLRPNLYHELSSYCTDSTEIIAFAVDFDFYSSRPAILPSTSPRDRVSTFSDDRLEQIIQVIRDLSEEKLGLMERIVDKFQKYPARDLAQAYQHFSLSIKKQ